MTDVKKRIEELRSILHYHSRKYYLEDAPKYRMLNTTNFFMSLLNLKKKIRNTMTVILLRCVLVENPAKNLKK